MRTRRMDAHGTWALGHLLFSSCYHLLDGDRLADEDGDLTLEEFHWGAGGLEDHKEKFWYIRGSACNGYG